VSKAAFAAADSRLGASLFAWAWVVIDPIVDQLSRRIGAAHARHAADFGAEALDLVVQRFRDQNSISDPRLDVIWDFRPVRHEVALHVSIMLTPRTRAASTSFLMRLDAKISRRRTLALSRPGAPQRKPREISSGGSSTS